MSEEPLKNDAYWREKLSAHEFTICRKKGTERAFTGEYSRVLGHARTWHICLPVLW